MSLIRIGRNSAVASPDPSDLWLPIFGGEVITAQRESYLFPMFVNTKPSTNGQVAVFPATWKIGSEYHQVGDEMLGLQTELREYVIPLDKRPLVSHFEVDDIDVAMAHFETRSEFAAQCGFALGKRDDQNVARLIVKAARAAADSSGVFLPGGNQLHGTVIEGQTIDLSACTNAAFGTADAAGALQVIAALDQIAIARDLTDSPETDWVCVLRPAMWYQLRKLTNLVSAGTVLPGPIMGHKDYDTANPQFAQYVSRNEYLVYNGFHIYRSNRVPTGDAAANTIFSPIYQGDYSYTQGVVFQRDAVGRAEMMGITAESTRDTRRGVDFTVVKMLTGGGSLRPHLAFELRTASPGTVTLPTRSAPGN